jgi:hypothetical protein
VLWGLNEKSRACNLGQYSLTDVFSQRTVKKGGIGGIGEEEVYEVNLFSKEKILRKTSLFFFDYSQSDTPFCLD